MTRAQAASTVTGYRAQGLTLPEFLVLVGTALGLWATVRELLTRCW